MTMPLPFTKMEACGNDYVFVDAIHDRFDLERASELARRWSHRHFGIGADGLIVLLPGERAALRMAMWNADGSRGAMCGNGLRCLARFAVDGGHSDGRGAFSIETDVGPRSVELLDDDDVRAEIGVVGLGTARSVEVDGDMVVLTPGDAGNPHAVVFVDDVETAPVERIGARLQQHPAFPDGVNVEFVHRVGDATIRQRTFERGSGETMACGTGAAVAATAARRHWNIRGARAQVELRGGRLAVVWNGPSLAIEGPARTVYRGCVALPT